MTDLHRQSPLCFRPAEDDRAWLVRYTRHTGRSVYAVLAEALAEYRQRHAPEEAGRSRFPLSRTDAPED